MGGSADLRTMSGGPPGKRAERITVHCRPSGNTWRSGAQWKRIIRNSFPKEYRAA